MVHWFPLRFILGEVCGVVRLRKSLPDLSILEAFRMTSSVENLADPLNTFIEVACVDRHGWHGSGTLEHAGLILSRYPDIATGSIYSAAVLADEAAVRSWLARDASLATAAGGPHAWDALTY